MKTVAVMQPYFFPYAGYFRLFVVADVVVLLDTVQFPKGGWVHRNRLLDDRGLPRWLTLPIVRPRLGDTIESLRFPDDFSTLILGVMRRFPCLRVAWDKQDPLLARMIEADATVSDYLIKLLGACCSRLAIPFNVVRASAMNVATGLTGQERILALVAALGGDRYVNLSGGRALYDHQRFNEASIDLNFFVPYQGSAISMLQRLLTEPAERLAQEIRDQSTFSP